MNNSNVINILSSDNSNIAYIKAQNRQIMTTIVCRILKFESMIKKKKKKEKNWKKISKELMSVAWDPKRWWSFCMSEDENKEVEPIFTK